MESSLSQQPVHSEPVTEDSTDRALTQDVAHLPVASDSGSTAVVAVLTAPVDTAATDDSVQAMKAVLVALREQSYPVDHTVVVVPGAPLRDRVLSELADFFDTLTARVESPFSRDVVLTVAAELADPAINLADESVAGPIDTAAASTWWWELTIDQVPHADCLAELLSAVRHRPDAAIVAPKCQIASDPVAVVDLGFTKTATGRPIPIVLQPEPDQGQHDETTDILAVNVGGFLARGDVVHAVATTGAPDRPVRSNLEFSDVVRRLGHAVIAAPLAVTTTESEPGRPDRGNVVALALARSKCVPLTAMLLVFTAWLRLIGRSLLKDPQRGWRDLSQTHSALADREHNKAMRARMKQLRPDHAVAVPLLPEADLRLSVVDSLRFHRDRWRAAFYPDAVVQRTDALVNVWGRLGAQLGIAVALLVVGAWAWRDVVFAPVAHGGALGAGFGSHTALWHQGVSDWSADGAGEKMWQPALLLLSGAVAAVGGDPNVVAVGLIVGTPVLAALCMWHAARHASGSLLIQSVASLLWASTPVLTTTIGHGALLSAVAVALLPVPLARMARRVTRHRTAKAIQRASITGCQVAFIGVLDPMTGWALVSVLCVLTVWHRNSVMAHLWSVVVGSSTVVLPLVHAVVLGVPVAALVPVGVWVPRESAPVWAWFAGVFDEPVMWQAPAFAARLLSGPLLPVVPGLVVVFVAVVGTLWVANVSRAASSVCAALWLAAGGAVLLTMGAAWWPGQWGQLSVVSWVGPSAVVACVVVLVATRSLAVAVSQGRAPRRQRGMQVVAGLLLVVAVAQCVALPMVRSGSLTGGERTGQWAIPLAAHDAALGPDQSRTLVLATSGDSIQGRLVAHGGRTVATFNPVSLAESTGPNVSAQRAAVAETVGQLSAENTSTVESLRRLAVGYVSVVDDALSARQSAIGQLPAATELLVNRLNSTAGVVPVATTDGIHTWRVDTGQSVSGAQGSRPASAYVVVEETGVSTPLPAALNGHVRVTIPAGPPGRRVVLAHQASSMWSASLAGQELTPVTMYGWAQAFTVPESGGELVVSKRSGVNDWFQWGLIVLLVIAGVGCLPVAAPRMQFTAAKKVVRV